MPPMSCSDMARISSGFRFELRRANSNDPVAVMGDGSVRTAAAAAIGATQPVLYIELRKDGAAIDPGPWWAKTDIEKARG